MCLTNATGHVLGKQKHFEQTVYAKRATLKTKIGLVALATPEPHLKQHGNYAECISLLPNLTKISQVVYENSASKKKLRTYPSMVETEKLRAYIKSSSNPSEISSTD